MIEAVIIYILRILLIIIGATVVGGLLTGFDRIISAKMQRRKGPPLLQPFYDVIKLAQKQSTTVNNATRFYVTFSLCFSVLTVVLFCLGFDLLLCIFAFTLSCIFFVISGYSSYSPFSFVGTERELIQIMCYEPMVLMTAFGFYKVSGSFSIAANFTLDAPAIIKLPLIFVGFSYIITIKLRKSPFDLSMSHHGHQEIVKGIITELTGICLAMVEVSHWFETVFALAIIYIFFVYAATFSWIVAILIAFLLFFFEIIVDNAFARVKWKPALGFSWIITGICGGINLFILMLIR
ncbi:MAG: NADH-quinone oxidoreductase subunit H [Oscillospiraceae bacterium]|nr:NADH-quinone oxidoreductase subunit H [Oscillospiraceae bacterium]